ncbi:hypothetical protein GCM10009654_32710 [Streptomyces hebeiensis]|uniref:Type III effector protein n=1 Tax=Streptomyces hebeiensis TaxID=229486 RepID=A0ABN1UVP3_9ACTN
MPPADQSTSPGADSTGPVPFLATAAALQAIDEALRAAQHEVTGATETHGIGTDQALASLLLLRQVREQLAGWETGLIETARHAGAGWADLAHPLGVAGRQAAERRYLRNRPRTSPSRAGLIAARRRKDAAGGRMPFSTTDLTCSRVFPRRPISR